LPQWLWISEKNTIFNVCQAQGATLPSCTRCRDVLAGRAGLHSSAARRAPCPTSSLLPSRRRATAHGDLQPQLLVSITPKQGFSMAKGFQLRHRSPPRAAAKHEEGSLAGGFHPLLSASRLAAGPCEPTRPIRVPRGSAPGIGFRRPARLLGSRGRRRRAVQGTAPRGTPAAPESESRAESRTLGLADGREHPRLLNAVTAR